MLLVGIYKLICHRRRRSLLLSQLRGYRASMRRSSGSELVTLIDSLFFSEILLPSSRIDSYYFRHAKCHVRAAIAQKLSLEQAQLVRKLLINSVSPAQNLQALAVPGEWLRLIGNASFAFSRRKSVLLWNLVVIKELLKGVFFGVQTILSSLARPSAIAGRGVYYFDDLTAGQLSSSSDLHTLTKWFARFIPGHIEDAVFLHGVRSGISHSACDGLSIRYQKDPIPPLRDALSLAQFCLWLASGLSIALLQFLRGKWHYAYLFPDLVRLVHVDLHDAKDLPEAYYFNNSRLYRPPWTYAAQSKGVNIVYYFYSANLLQICSADLKTHPFSAYSRMQWPVCLVWTDKQRRHLQASSMAERFEVVGPIWTSDSDCLTPVLSSRSIAVFDVSPKRLLSYSLLCQHYDYYVPRVVNAFLDDIVDLADEFGVDVYHKAKRNNRALLHPSHFRLLRALESRRVYHRVPPQVAATRLISQVGAVISLPFTSTAISAAFQSKESIFYSPISWTDSVASSHDGIRIISSKADLREWFSANF